VTGMTRGAGAAGGRAEGVVPARTRLALRVGLGLLTLTVLVEGVWATLFPRGFYDNFPLPGHHWVSMLPPYNEHLITDIGEFNLVVAVGLLVAAVTVNRLLVRTVLVGFLGYAVPHLIFHADHLAGFSTGDAAAQTAALVVDAVLPLILLALTGTPRLPGAGRGRSSSEHGTGGGSNLR
jgi:hypothetical protein